MHRDKPIYVDGKFGFLKHDRVLHGLLQPYSHRFGLFEPSETLFATIYGWQGAEKTASP